MNERELDELCYRIIGAAFEVRSNLGRHLYEGIYEEALHLELRLRGVESRRQVYIPVYYKGIQLKDPYKVDILVENIIPIELKSLSTMGTAEFSQIMSYLKFGGYNIGYLINFDAVDFAPASIPDDMNLNKGIYRVVKSK